MARLTAAFRALRSACAADRDAPRDAFSACSSLMLACRAAALASAEARAAPREAAFLDALHGLHARWVRQCNAHKPPDPSRGWLCLGIDE